MAFAYKGPGGTAISSVANQATATLTTTSNGAIGDLAVLVYAMDNQVITDGDENAVTVVTTNDTNIWIKAKEFTNGQAAIQAGATVGLWFCNLIKPIPAGTPIVLTIGNPPARDATALSLSYFTEAPNSTAVVEATNALAVDGSAIGSLNAVTTNISCLRIRATASESNSNTAWTKTAAFDGLFTQAITAGGGTAVNQGIRAEYDISSGTGVASQPTGGAGAVDHASIYVAFREVSAQFITPLLYDDTAVFFAPGEVSYYFVSGGVIDVDEVFAEAEVGTSYTIYDHDVYDDTDIFAALDVHCADLELAAVSVVDEDDIYSVIVISNARHEIGLVEDEDIFYETGVSTIWLILDDVHDDHDDYTTDTVITNVNIIIHEPISFDEIIPAGFVTYNQALTGEIIIEDDFHGPDIATGENPIGAGGITDGDQIPSASFGTDFVPAPPLLEADDIFHVPMLVGAGTAQLLQPTAHDDVDVAHIPILARGAVVIEALPHEDNDNMVPPFTAKRRYVRSGVGVIKGTVDTVTLIGERDKAA